MGVVKAFPLFNMSNIPEALRKLANDIDRDPDMADRCVVVLESSDGLVHYKAFGADPFTISHARACATSQEPTFRQGVNVFHCKSAGQARGCNSCKNNPIHQLTESRRQTIAPTVSKSGECKQYVGKIEKVNK